MPKPKKWKRKKPISARGHCKMCKFWKINGFGRYNPESERFSDHKRRYFAREEERKYS